MQNTKSPVKAKLKSFLASVHWSNLLETAIYIRAMRSMCVWCFTISQFVLCTQQYRGHQVQEYTLPPLAYRGHAFHPVELLVR